MKIYTGNAYSPTDLGEIDRLDMGIMISSGIDPSKEWRGLSCALDNGAFGCYRRGFPFQEELFLENIKKCHKAGLTLDFIVAPDIIGGEYRSLIYSIEWIKGKLRTAPRVALVVQDGMNPDRLEMYGLENVSHIFVGGSVEWKWHNAKMWVDWSHEKGLKCHIGQCGQLKWFKYAKNIGADSVDSTSIVRNKSWHIVDEFLAKPKQTEWTE